MWRPVRLVEELVQEIRRAAGVPDHPPVDVEAMVQILHIALSEDAQMKHDGRLIRAGGQSTILLRAGQDRVRRRFTIAHEVGHWAIQHREDPKALDARAAFRSEETMCNIVAGALLLPRPWLRGTFPHAFQQEHHTLTLLCDIARAAQASFGATAVRLRDVFGWRKTLLHFVREPEGWVFDGEAGVFPWEQGLVIPGQWAGSQIDDVRATAGADGQAAGTRLIPMAGTAYGDHVHAEIRTWSGRAIALIPAPASAPRVELAPPVAA